MSAQVFFFPPVTLGMLIDEGDAVPCDKVREALWRHLRTARRLEDKEDQKSRRIYQRALITSWALLARLIFEIEGVPQRRGARIA